MNYEEYYSDKKRCFDDICQARKGWGYSQESDEQIRKTLGLMFIYCPSEISDIVQATMEELDRRMELCLFREDYLKPEARL